MHFNRIILCVEFIKTNQKQPVVLLYENHSFFAWFCAFLTTWCVKLLFFTTTIFTSIFIKLFFLLILLGLNEFLLLKRPCNFSGVKFSTITVYYTCPHLFYSIYNFEFVHNVQLKISLFFFAWNSKNSSLLYNYLIGFCGKLCMADSGRNTAYTDESLLKPN